MAAAEPHTTAMPPLFSRRVKVIAILLALGLTAWLAVAWFGRSQVRVVAAEELLTCQGTEVVVEEAIGNRDAQMPYAVMGEQMRCSVHFRVRNQGPLPVRVRWVSLRNYGPDGGMWAQATSMEPFQAAPPPVGHPFQNDAVFVPAEPYRLGAGEVAEFAIDLVYRPPGCRGGEGWSSVPDGPRVRVNVWGISGDRVLADDSFGLACVGR
jgi:hypothetical protein